MIGKQSKRFLMRSLSPFLGSGIFLLVVFALLGTALSAQAQGPNWEETGDVCVQFYRPGAGCTANDVRIEEVKYTSISNQCYEDPVGTMTVTLEALVSAESSPNRWDIGLFIALAGNTSALTGTQCYHTCLPPPVSTTPVYGDFNTDLIPDIYEDEWWDGDEDTCGDMETNTQVFRVMDALTLDCQDLDLDGAADVSVCASWDNNTNTACNSVEEAVPGTNSKCSCQIVNFDFTPTAVGAGNVAVTRSQVSVPLALLAVLALVGLTILAVRRLRPIRVPIRRSE